MKKRLVNYELPKLLPAGWKKEVAERLGIHRNTVRNALNRGEKDPIYKKIVHTAAIMFGKPKENSDEKTIK